MSYHDKGRIGMLRLENRMLRIEVAMSRRLLRWAAKMLLWILWEGC